MARRPSSSGSRRVPDAASGARAVRSHPLEWVLEPLESHPAYFRRKIFGCEAAYVGGKLRLVVAAGGEPWNGLMVATRREAHPALRAEWKALAPHPVLGKWLYLSQDDPRFETVALAIARAVRQGDPRIGVEPRPRKRREAKAESPKPRRGR